MAVKLIKQEDGVSRKVDDAYSVLNLLTAEDSNNVSVAVSTAENCDKTTKTTSERAYYILEGELIADEEIIAKKGDIIFIPANTDYSFKGTFKAIIINSPPFRKGNETSTK